MKEIFSIKTIIIKIVNKCIKIILKNEFKYYIYSETSKENFPIKCCYQDKECNQLCQAFSAVFKKSRELFRFYVSCDCNKGIFKFMFTKEEAKQLNLIKKDFER